MCRNTDLAGSLRSAAISAPPAVTTVPSRRNRSAKPATKPPSTGRNASPAPQMTAPPPIQRAPIAVGRCPPDRSEATTREAAAESAAIPPMTAPATRT